MELMNKDEMAAHFAALADRLDRLESKQAPATDGRVHFGRTEAAEYIGLSLKKLDGLAEAGDIRRAKFGAGKRARVIYRRCDLDAFVEAHLELDAEGARRMARGLQGILLPFLLPYPVYYALLSTFLCAPLKC